MSDQNDDGRHRSEGAMRAEAIYHALSRSSSDGLYLFRGTRCIDCNKKAAEILGWPMDRILGVTPWELSPPTQPDGRDSRAAGEALMARARGGECLVFDWVHSRSDGSLVDVEVGLHSVVKDDEPFVVALLRDVSARKSAEEALRSSEAKYAAAFHAGPDAISITSLEEGEIIEVNEAFDRLFGHSRDEAIGNSAIGLGLWVEPSQRTELIGRLKKGETVRGFEAAFRTKSGREGVCELSAEVLDFAGEPQIHMVVHDITERSRAEDEKRRAYEEIARLKDELERERDYLREEVDVSLHFGEIVGTSPSLRRVLTEVEAVAATDASVLIMGETGVGKELIARAIHAKSTRASRPLVKVNCSSIPRELFETEFFGHVKGAFTGAHRDRVGRFQLADGGTLFLDEVSEIPVDLQAKLLRVLQEGEFERVGEDITRHVDARVIAATNQDLTAQVAEGAFRSDLYFRLSVFPVNVPPLKERGDDVIDLARHFLKVICHDLGREPLSLSQAHAHSLRAYEWPGNIRELRNVLERAAILSRGERLRLDLALPEARVPGSDRSPSAQEGERRSNVLDADELKSFQRQNIIAALQETGWKVSGKGGAAELLGLNASTLTYQMKAFGMEKPS